jgi:hypothetical protein
VKLNELDWADLQLVPAERLMGHSDDEWSDVEIKAAVPVVLDAIEYLKSTDSVDPAMDLLKDRSDFHYIRTPVSIKPSERWRVRLLSVQLVFVNQTGSVEALSMMPVKVETERKVRTNGKLSPTLKISEVEIPLGEIAAGEEHVEYQPLIEAYDLGSDKPMWEFTPQPKREFRGVQLLHLVVRQPKGSTASVCIQMRIELERSGGFLWRLLARENSAMHKRLNFLVPH